MPLEKPTKRLPFFLCLLPAADGRVAPCKATVRWALAAWMVSGHSSRLPLPAPVRSLDSQLPLPKARRSDG